MQKTSFPTRHPSLLPVGILLGVLALSPAALRAQVQSSAVPAAALVPASIPTLTPGGYRPDAAPGKPLVATTAMPADFANQKPAASEDTLKPKLRLTFPLLDFPYGRHASQVREGVVANVGERPTGYNPLKALRSPSMDQSTQFLLDTRYALFYGSQRLLHRRPTDKRFRKVWKTGAEVLLNSALDLAVPFGQGWQHEEFHRAVLTRFNTYSNNTLNDWLTGKTNANTAYASGVNMVLDANLVALKATSNPNFVRLSAAGGEGEIYGGELMQQNNFFYNPGYLNSLSIVIRFVSPHLYLRTCSDKAEVNKFVVSAFSAEGSDQSLRDFTGADFTAWAYDLYNPNGPYSARGLHPNGNGYDRYIYGSKLSDDQYAWLRIWCSPKTGQQG